MKLTGRALRARRSSLASKKAKKSRVVFIRKAETPPARVILSRKQTESRKHRRLLERLSSKLVAKIEKRKAKLAGPVAVATVQGKYGRILDWDHHDPTKQVTLSQIVTRIVALAQTLAEKRFYDYQVELAFRIIESVLLHDGEVITALIARQSGKTETLSSVVAALGIILPKLAVTYPDDWRLNITDEKGGYRGFRNGIQIGIYAPRREQAEIMFNRIKNALESDTGTQVLKELNLKMSESNGDRIRLTNGTRILSQSASEQSKIEGATHHLLIAEEAQDISDLKVRKSLHPMVSSLLGTMVKIGTATTRKCDFYQAIKTNERAEVLTGKRNNFFYPHIITSRYNSLYRKYVEKERIRLGEDSDEFRMAYNCLIGTTPVFLRDGSTKPISEIEEGDEVISHTGEIREVTYRKDKGIQPTVRLTFYGAEDVICTPDHRFLTEKGWTAARNLTKENALLIPRPLFKETERFAYLIHRRSRKNTTAKKIPSKLALSSELGEFLGWFVAEGSANQQNHSQVCFSLAENEVTEALRIQELLFQLFGLDSENTVIPTGRVVSANSCDLNRWLTRTFQHKAPNKKLPSWFLDAPKPFLKAFLLALWEGDGCYLSNRSGSFCTSSKTLWRQVDLLLRCFGVLASSYEFEREPSEYKGRVIKGGKMFQLWVYGLQSRDITDRKRTKRQKTQFNKGYLIRRLKGRSAGVPERVWDIEVSGDHSFCTPAATPHNCEWIFERGMFITQAQLFHADVVQSYGIFSLIHPKGLHRNLANYDIVVGIDWGSSSDSTVLTIMAVDWHKPMETGSYVELDGTHDYVFYQKHVLGWLEFIGDNYESQYWQIFNYLQSFAKLSKIVTDSNTCGLPIFDRLTASFAGSGVEVVPYNFNQRLKSDGYKSLYADFCGHRVTFPANVDVRKTIPWRKFVNQMLDLRKDYKNGLMVVSHPDERGAHDDYCFPAGAPVVTDKGNVPIDQIRVGDQVLTSKGYRRVLASSQTGVKPLMRVGNLIGTANHPVWCENRGMYVRLDSLLLSDTVLECLKISDLKKGKQLSTTVRSSTDTQLLQEENTVSIFGRIRNGKNRQSRFIGINGLSSKGQFRKVLSSTTKTATVETIGSETSNSCLAEPTSVCTLPSPPESPLHGKTLGRRKKQHKPVGGTNRLKQGNQCVNGHCFNQPAVNEGSDVRSAVPLTPLNPLRNHSLVPVSVAAVAGDERTIKRFLKSNASAESVLVPVYNLTVEDVNEYICQGVLVHNCDSLCMAAWGCNTPSGHTGVEMLSGNMFFNR